MPDVLLSVPHFEQSRDRMCLPACARMVMAYWGQNASEAEIAKSLGTKEFDTPISNVERLRQRKYNVEFDSLTLEQLKAHLTNHRPVIARVWTPMLDYWDEYETSHVVVLIGFDDSFVYVNDPALPEAPQHIVWDGFLAAWAEFDEIAAVVCPA